MQVGDRQINISDFYEVLYQKNNIHISEKALERVINSFNYLQNYCNDKIIYGINTGLGPMAQYKISDKDRLALQYNAIRSHSAGMGKRIPDKDIRSAMICSLNAYLRGNSCIDHEVPKLLKNLINLSIIPFVPEHGGVGASGDLVQLAHIGLVLIGEGYVSYKGQIVPTMLALNENNLKPLQIKLREGLSLINGTYVMTGIGIVNLIEARNLLNWSVAASAIINEIVGSFNDYFSEELNNIKLHQGQRDIAHQIRVFVKDSKLIRQRKDVFFNNKTDESIMHDKVQEYYSVRCVPQILGVVSDTLNYCERILIEEANSSSDNPVLDIESETIFHGGNFHGEYVAAEMDKMKMSVVKISMLAERQLNFLLNSKLNEKLPPFVNLGTLGVNFGMQGAQFTATSTTAENQTLAHPVHTHSISCNNDNQDIVSMGTNAALMAKRVIDNTAQVLAIQFMAILQAIDALNIKEGLSSAGQDIYTQLRSISPPFLEDTPRYEELENIKKYIQEHHLKL